MCGSFHMEERTPVWTTNNSSITDLGCGDTKICQFYTSVFVGENIGPFNVSMDHSLVVQVHKPSQNLGNVDSYEAFWELAKPFADVV